MKSYCGSSTALLEGLAEVLGMACGFDGSQSCWLGLLGRGLGGLLGGVCGRVLLRTAFMCATAIAEKRRAFCWRLGCWAVVQSETDWCLVYDFG